MKMLIFSLLFLLFAYGGVLESVQSRGYINCGVNHELEGFSQKKDNEWSGVDVDYCRAISAAIFGKPTFVKFIPLSSKERFRALEDDRVDILSRNTTWTYTRDTKYNIKFVGINYYDSQGFLILKDFGLDSAKELNNAIICMAKNTTVENSVKDYFIVNKMKYTKIVDNDSSKRPLRILFEKGRCDILADDKSMLYILKSQMKDPSLYKILPEDISREPLGPSVKGGDSIWFNIARWTLNILIEAEELEVTNTNIKLYLENTNPRIKRLIGIGFNSGVMLGLPDNWSFNIISSVGNFGNIFERNLGKHSKLKMNRGLNRLWTKGGLLYALPVR